MAYLQTVYTFQLGWMPFTANALYANPLLQDDATFYFLCFTLLSLDCFTADFDEPTEDHPLQLPPTGGAPKMYFFSRPPEE